MEEAGARKTVEQLIADKDAQRIEIKRLKAEVERLKAENEKLKANQELWGSIELITAQRKEIEQLREALELAKEWTEQIANDERVCGWIHREDYGLYCLLAGGCPVNFDEATERHQCLRE